MERLSKRVLAVSGFCALGIVAAGGVGPGRSAAAEFDPDAALPNDLASAGLIAKGSVVRRAGPLLVERLRLPEDLSQEPVWRVTISGRYPPRAMRYLVLAGGDPIAYGMPSGNQRRLRAVSADPRVLTARLTARYEGPVQELDAGSTISGPPGTGAAGARSPRGSEATPGPLAVTRTSYDLGAQAYHPPGLVSPKIPPPKPPRKGAGRPGKKGHPQELRRKKRPKLVRRAVELTASVHHPTDLGAGPFPLVLFMHGNHASCYRGKRSDFVWPCRKGWTPMPNHIGYDYIAENLASYGYIVVSVSANGVNVHGSLLRDTGMRQRGLLLERHLELWQQWNAAGAPPFGSQFAGRVDMTRIGTMGHSRGGEGAIWQVIVDGGRPQPFGIDAVMAVAPVDFTRRTLTGIPLGVVLPYCDGDVSTLEGAHYFDDARYRLRGDPAPKHQVSLLHSNHNFFNTVWTPRLGFPDAVDDGFNCKNQISATDQRRAAIAYVSGFFRRYLGPEPGLDRFWTGEATPASLAPEQAQVAYQPPDLAGRRLDLAPFTGRGNLRLDNLGGPVLAAGLARFGWCASTKKRPCFPRGLVVTDANQPGLARGDLAWRKRAAKLSFGIPAGAGNVSGFDAFQLRASLNPTSRLNRRAPRIDLVVTLVDGSGARASLAASQTASGALSFLPGLRFARAKTRNPPLSDRTVISPLRFPLASFAGIDLADLRAVELDFSRAPRGAIQLADLAFASGAP